MAVTVPHCWKQLTQEVNLKLCYLFYRCNTLHENRKMIAALVFVRKAKCVYALKVLPVYEITAFRNLNQADF